MRKLIYTLIIFSFVYFITACDNKEEFNHDSDFNLTFSKESISFDTIFSGLPSTTSQLKIYNLSSKTIQIDEIHLENDSDYQLNINGIIGNNSNKTEILPKDSLYIFIKLNTEDLNQDEPRLIEDHILFTFNSKVLRFPLKSWSQDVIRFSQNELESQTWTKNRPYLIDQDITLKENHKLSILAGTKVYFQKGAGLHIKGELNIEGSYEEPVFFGSSRREELYKNIPGQWNGLFFYAESKNNFISHFQLENAAEGITALSDVNDNNLKIEYSKLLNFTKTGIKTQNFNLNMHDVIVSSCGEQNILLQGDGDFEFSHCNFINYWQISSRTNTCFSYLANETNDKNLNIYNSIIYGSNTNELEINNINNIEIINSLIKLEEEKQNIFAASFKGCIFNMDPDFSNKYEHNYNLRQGSPLINTAKLDYANQHPFDYNGNSRISDTQPDIGCFEFIDKTE
ncbi:choice-of-anchor Q domain-containing protein [Ancylomarina sp. 16SWW S1-10-2]|uniref:choice-of-anchor Q domain-containing protein n=1 Tax=Ancylomarina sp. 16SWW S1-10-2 TaxID=2499681 RepID=UPI0012AE376E|nr:choice-of-anchor Q domain-containing protein [Ancylomarina sp. 16SWW S1-10-2]MRT91819.1 hypothetical protein [Ancylomarina sp. 16SWW S1-10-2]